MPRSLPYFFASLKVAITLAFIGTVVSETVASNEGIGYLMMSAGSSMKMPLVFAGLTVIGVMAMAMYEFFAVLERRMTGWATAASKRRLSRETRKGQGTIMMHGWIPPQRYLAYLTWTDIRDLPDKANTVILQPVGAIEQHGPHLPVAVDSAICTGVLGAALDRLPAEVPCFCLPPLYYGKSNEHIRFPGTVTLSAETLLRVFGEVADSVHRMGLPEARVRQRARRPAASGRDRRAGRARAPSGLDSVSAVRSGACRARGSSG